MIEKITDEQEKFLKAEGKVVVKAVADIKAP